jgi:hypothetical protein
MEINKFDIQITPEEDPQAAMFENRDFVAEVMTDLERQYDENFGDMMEAVKEEETA